METLNDIVMRQYRATYSWCDNVDIFTDLTEAENAIAGACEAIGAMKDLPAGRYAACVHEYTAAFTDAEVAMSATEDAEVGYDYLRGLANDDGRWQPVSAIPVSKVEL